MKNRNSRGTRSKVTIGMDNSDKKNAVCILRNDTGEVIERTSVANTPEAITAFFSLFPPTSVAFEVGCHSPWINDVLTQLGHDTVVANPRQVALISRSIRKTDKHDAELLARLLRADRELLRAVTNGGEVGR